MRTFILGSINTILTILLLILIGYVVTLVIKALRKYIRSNEINTQTKDMQLSLGDTIKRYRTDRNMTQEFVAEYLGVSRQAVSKWESGKTFPSTQNIFALADLFETEASELMKK